MRTNKLLYGFLFGIAVVLLIAAGPSPIPPPQKASIAETTAGTDDKKYVTPAGVAAFSIAQGNGITAAQATNVALGIISSGSNAVFSRIDADYIGVISGVMAPYFNGSGQFLAGFADVNASGQISSPNFIGNGVGLTNISAGVTYKTYNSITVAGCPTTAFNATYTVNETGNKYTNSTTAYISRQSDSSFYLGTGTGTYYKSSKGSGADWQNSSSVIVGGMSSTSSLGNRSLIDNDIIGGQGARFVGDGSGLSNLTAFVSSPTPTNDTGVYTFEHGLGSTPRIVRIVLRCVSNDSNFEATIGQEVDIYSFSFEGSSVFAVVTDSTNIKIYSSAFAAEGEGNCVALKFSYPGGNVSPSSWGNWRLVVYAQR